MYESVAEIKHVIFMIETSYNLVLTYFWLHISTTSCEKQNIS